MQVLDSLIEGPLRLRSRREGDELIGMIVRYLATGDEPEPRTNVQEAVITSVMPVLAKSRARIVAGSNGGSKTPSKQASKTVSKTTSNDASACESKAPSEEEEEEELGRGTRNEESGVRNEEKGEKAARFRAPSPAEVAEYAQQFATSKGLDLASLDFDPERFVDFYEGKGWMAGRVHMKDWRATVRNWVRGSKPKNGKEAPDDGFSAYD